MIRALGEVLPLAVGIAISPLAVIVVIVMLMTARGRANAWAFTTGWLIGAASVTAVALAVADGADAATDPDTRDGIDVVHLLIGVLFVVLAIRTWRKRPPGGAPPTEPKYFSTIESLSVVKAVGAGVAIATVAAPKNVALEIAAGTTIAERGLSMASDVAVVVLFAIVTAVPLIVPVMAASVEPARSAASLAGARRWLVTNNTVIMLVLFVVLAAHNLGQGLGVTG